MRKRTGALCLEECNRNIRSKKLIIDVILNREPEADHCATNRFPGFYRMVISHNSNLFPCNKTVKIRAQEDQN